MILSFAELRDEKKFVCPWHLSSGGGRCGQSLAVASVIVDQASKKYADVAAVIEKADDGETQVFWCPQCGGAIFIAPVEQGFKVGIPTS